MTGAATRCDLEARPQDQKHPADGVRIEVRIKLGGLDAIANASSEERDDNLAGVIIEGIDFGVRSAELDDRPDPQASAFDIVAGAQSNQQGRLDALGGSPLRKGLGHLRKRAGRVPAQGLEEQASFVSKRAVEALPADAHALKQIAGRSRFKSVAREYPDRAGDRFVSIELGRSSHVSTVQIFDRSVQKILDCMILNEELVSD